MQEQMWTLHLMDPSSSSHNVPLLFDLKGGQVDPARVRSSLFAVIKCHEILRTVFDVVDGELCQVIQSLSSFSSENSEDGSFVSSDRFFTLVDLSRVPFERYKYALRRATRDLHLPFSMRNGPLIRCSLYRIENDHHILSFCFHHVVIDGYSLQLFMGDFMTAYNSNQAIPLKPPELQYKDYAVWQRKHLAGEVVRGDQDYWKKKLEGVSPLEFPTDKPRPPVQTYHGDCVYFDLEESTVKKLNAFVSSHVGTTKFMVFVAAFQALLHRYSNQEDIVVGTAVSQRSHNTEGTVGCFVNTMVLRSQVKALMQFNELVNSVRKTTLEALDHHNLPFGKLVEYLQPLRDMSTNPIFSVYLVFQNFPHSDLNLSGIPNVDFIRVGETAAQFDLSLYLEPRQIGQSAVCTFQERGS